MSLTHETVEFSEASERGDLVAEALTPEVFVEEVRASEAAPTADDTHGGIPPEIRKVHEGIGSLTNVVKVEIEQTHGRVQDGSVTDSSGSDDNNDGERPSAPALQAGGSGGQAPPPNDGISASAEVPDDDPEPNDDGVSEDAKFQETPEFTPDEVEFNKVIDRLLSFREQLQDRKPTFTIEYPTDPTPEEPNEQATSATPLSKANVKIYFDAPLSEDEPVPEGHTVGRLSFTLDNPEVIPCDTAEKEAGARLLTTDAVVDMIAKHAPTPETFQKGVDLFDEWVGSPGYEQDKQLYSQVERQGSGRFTMHTIAAAKSVIFGAMRQFDIAESRGDTYDMQPTITMATDKAMEVSKNLSVTRKTLRDMITHTLHDENPTSGQNVGWRGLVSKTAACEAAYIMQKETSVPDVLFADTLRSGIVFRDEEVAEVVHDIITRPGATDAFDDFRDLQKTVEFFMGQVIEHVATDPSRDERAVNALKNLRRPNNVPGLPDSVPIEKILQLANTAARAEGRPGFDRTNISSYAMVGEALLYILEYTHQGESLVRRAQLDQDRRYSEIVTMATSKIPGRHAAKQQLTFMDLAKRFPEATPNELRRLADRYLNGDVSEVIVAHYARQKAGRKGVRSIRRPGYGRVT